MVAVFWIARFGPAWVAVGLPPAVQVVSALMEVAAFLIAQFVPALTAMAVAAFLIV